MKRYASILFERPKSFPGVSGHTTSFSESEGFTITRDGDEVSVERGGVVIGAPWSAVAQTEPGFRRDPDATTAAPEPTVPEPSPTLPALPESADPPELTKPDAPMPKKRGRRG